jgi:hypothetical protein
MNGSKESVSEKERVGAVATAGKSKTKMKNEGKEQKPMMVLFIYVRARLNEPHQTSAVNIPKIFFYYSVTSNTVRVTWSAFRPVCFKNPIKSSS